MHSTAPKRRDLNAAQVTILAATAAFVLSAAAIVSGVVAGGGGWGASWAPNAGVTFLATGLTILAINFAVARRERDAELRREASQVKPMVEIATDRLEQIGVRAERFLYAWFAHFPEERPRTNAIAEEVAREHDPQNWLAVAFWAWLRAAAEAPPFGYGRQPGDITALYRDLVVRAQAIQAECDRLLEIEALTPSAVLGASVVADVTIVRRFFADLEEAYQGVWWRRGGAEILDDPSAVAEALSRLRGVPPEDVPRSNPDYTRSLLADIWGGASFNPPP